MKFPTISLIVHAPDPATGALVSANERFRQVVDAAVPAEEPGFDGVGVGERHERPFISSSPTVVLSHIAAKTIEPVFPTLEGFVARSSALIGSPQQILEKVRRYREQFGHTVMRLQAEPSGLTPAEHRSWLERFQAEIAPVLRRKAWVRSIRTAEGAIHFPTPQEARAVPWTDADRALVADRVTSYRLLAEEWATREQR